MSAAAAGAAPVALGRPDSVEPPKGSTGVSIPTMWAPKGDIDVRDWILVGRRLGAMARCSQWLLGDWVRYGTKRWGEKYKEAARITGYDVHSLRNIAYVSGRIEMSRRRDNLTFSHHAEVCALDPAAQEEWLDRAGSERMSVSDLRHELRTARRRKEPPGETQSSKPAVGKVMCPECRHEFDVPE